MLKLLKQDARIGDTLNLYLTTGETIKGKIIELDDNYILLEVDGVNRRYFPQIIGGWNVEKSISQAIKQPEKVLSDTDEINDGPVVEDDELISTIIALYDKIYENEGIVLSDSIKTNAKVEKVTASGVTVITDNGETFYCHKGFMAGFSRTNCTSGERLFCGAPNNTGPQKGVCFISVLGMTFKDLRKRFIYAIISKPQPRRPIINSIIAYFRKNNSGKSTKKIIQQLRNMCLSLDSTGNNNKINSLVSSKLYEEAFSLLDQEISSSKTDKQKSNLLLRKAQLYSSLKRHDEAISSYKELITFNEQIGSPSKNLSHLYTEIARLFHLVGNEQQAEIARSHALELNPQNSIAKNIGSPSGAPELDATSDISTIENHSFPVLKLTDKSLVDEDIENHSFSDSEIVSLNGAVSDEIANRLLESASVSEDFLLHLEAAKALKELPIGSYSIQDLEDEINSYSLYKCRSLFNSFKKVIYESQSLYDIAFESLGYVKDCAIDYYLETIERINKEDPQIALELLTECLMLEIATLLLKKKEKKSVIENVFNYSLGDLLVYCEDPKQNGLVASLIITLVGYAITYVGIWENVILKSQHFNTFIQFVTSNNSIKQEIILKTPPANKRGAADPNFMDRLFRHELNRLGSYYRHLRKIERAKFDIDSISFLQKNFRYFNKTKSIRFFNSASNVTFQKMAQIIAAFSNYQVRDEEYKRIILSNALMSIEELIKLNTRTYSTKFGRFYFYPILLSWQQSLEKLREKETKVKIDCQLSLEVDSPYFYEENGKRSFALVIHNKSSFVVEGYKLTVWIGEDRKTGINKSTKKDILPEESIRLIIPIPNKQWGDLDAYEIKSAIQSLNFGSWSDELTNGATISKQHSVTFNSGDILWRDSGDTPIGMFKGRDEFVKELVRHYCSQRRNYTYVLYGLSRTGKSSILYALKRAITGREIEGVSSNRIILPFYITLDDAIQQGTHKFWDYFWTQVYSEQGRNADAMQYLKNKDPNRINGIKRITDFDEFIIELNSLNIHPLFMFDEFSYMQNLIDDGIITPAFLQHMKTISADKDQVSFIFAGTYDIDSFIHNPKYNISGSLYLKRRPIFEISKEAAEDLINVMHGRLDFTLAAKREIHKLTGDVPFWIQKLCMNCGFFAIEKDMPVIGISELEMVVGIMTGDYQRDTDVTPMNKDTFLKTQMLITDTEEMKIVLTSIAHLMRKPENSRGVSYEQIKALWSEFGYDVSNYNIKDAIDSLCERQTLLYTDFEERRYYRFSIDLFRRWWLHEHFVLDLQLSSFINKNIKKQRHESNSI